MPTLNWIGKEKVVNHHLDVAFRTLEKQYTLMNDAVHLTAPYDLMTE